MFRERKKFDIRKTIKVLKLSTAAAITVTSRNSFNSSGDALAKRHHVISGTLAPLYTVFGLKLGCSGAAAPIGDKVL